MYKMHTLDWTSQTPASPTQDWTELTEDALDSLGEMMSGVEFPWYLTGGLSIDAHFGRFSRRHDDMDILVPETALGDLKEAVEASDFRFMQRLAMIRFAGKRLYLYRDADPERDRNHLRAVGKSANPMLNYIDVYPYAEKLNGNIVPHYSGIEFKPSQVEGGVGTTRSGYKMPYVGLEYSGTLKRWRAGNKPKGKDAVDLALIESAVAARS